MLLRYVYFDSEVAIRFEHVQLTNGRNTQVFITSRRFRDELIMKEKQWRHLQLSDVPLLAVDLVA